MSWTLAVLGMACLLGDGLPFIQTLALYFLPLEYLLWIGIGLCAGVRPTLISGRVN